jgi:hypothetical protein
MKSKPSPLVFQFFLATARTDLRNHCALSSREDDDAIYVKIIVAMGAGDATMPVDYEDHSRNDQ